MNFRNIALVAAVVSVAGIANAQSFELKAGAGASLVGNTFVVAPSSSFSVELWLNPAANTTTGNSLVVSLAYDRSNATSGTTVAAVAPLDGKLVAAPASGELPAVEAAATSNWTSAITAGMTRARLTAAALTSGTTNINYASLGSARAVAWYWSRSGGTTNAIAAPIKLATFTFTANIANGDTYGDAATEAGLQVFATGIGGTSTGVAGGNSGLSGGAGPIGSAKYAVQAVPEPTTMAALGLGLAAIARRRRSNKK